MLRNRSVRNAILLLLLSSNLTQFICTLVNFQHLLSSFLPKVLWYHDDAIFRLLLNLQSRVFVETKQKERKKGKRGSGTWRDIPTRPYDQPSKVASIWWVKVKWLREARWMMIENEKSDAVNMTRLHYISIASLWMVNRGRKRQGCRLMFLLPVSCVYISLPRHCFV